MVPCGGYLITRVLFNLTPAATNKSHHPLLETMIYIIIIVIILFSIPAVYCNSESDSRVFIVVSLPQLSHQDATGWSTDISNWQIWLATQEIKKEAGERVRGRKMKEEEEGKKRKRKKEQEDWEKKEKEEKDKKR